LAANIQHLADAMARRKRAASDAIVPEALGGEY
jgi:hypothetical protein